MPTSTPSAAHTSRKLPSGWRVRVAALIIFSRPKRPGTLTTSIVRPSKVVATMRAPGAPPALGHTKLFHWVGPLR